MLDSSQRKDTPNHNVTAEQSLLSSVILNICEQFRKQLPHLEVQIPTVDDLSFRGSDQQPSACGKGRVFIHEIKEEDLLERQVAEGGHSVDFFYEILMDELVLCVPFYSVVKTFRDGKQIDEFQEPVKGLVEGLDDRRPTSLGVFIDLYLESKRDMGLDRPNMRYNSRMCYREEKQRNQARVH